MKAIAMSDPVIVKMKAMPNCSKMNPAIKVHRKALRPAEMVALNVLTVVKI